MVAPTTSEAREALALDRSAHYFDVSVVVFYKRPILTIDTSERLVAARVISTGTGGGELLLTKLSNDGADDPYEELRYRPVGDGKWPSHHRVPRKPRCSSRSGIVSSRSTTNSAGLFKTPTHKGWLAFAVRIGHGVRTPESAWAYSPARSPCIPRPCGWKRWEHTSSRKWAVSSGQ